MATITSDGSKWAKIARVSKPDMGSLHCYAFINQSRGDAPFVHEARSGLTDDWATLPLRRVDYDLGPVG